MHQVELCVAILTYNIIPGNSALCIAVCSASDADMGPCRTAAQGHQEAKDARRPQQRPARGPLLLVPRRQAAEPGGHRAPEGARPATPVPARPGHPRLQDVARAAAQPRRPKPHIRTRAWRTPRSCRRGCMQRCAAPFRRLTRRRLCGAHECRIGCWAQGAFAAGHAMPAARAARAHGLMQFAEMCANAKHSAHVPH